MGMVAKKDNFYNNGEVFYGFITHINNSNDFFVVDESNKLAEALNAVDLGKLERIFWVPEVGEMFMIYVEGDGYLRATRMPNERSNEIRIMLIDTGEESSVTARELVDENLFLMPGALKEIPPAAFRCALNNNLSDLLLDMMLYKKMTFEVIETKDGTAWVDVWKCTEDGKKSDEPEEQEINMREILAREESVNYDPQVALQGFHTRDDDRRCKFFNPRTGGCFKGGRCKLQHIPETTDGTCRDTKNVNFYDINPPPMPDLKTFHDIKIITFIDTHRFTCYYLDKNVFYNGKNLKDLREELKNGTYERYQGLPAVGELVTAKIDEKYYRVRILDEIDDDSKFQVYMVDEGRVVENVSCHQIFEYCGNLKEYPFFAIEMEIVDVSLVKEAKDAHKWIYTMQENAGPLKAFILDNLDGIKCMLFDVRYKIVGQWLVEKGLAKVKKIPEPKDLEGKSIIIPG